MVSEHALRFKSCTSTDLDLTFDTGAAASGVGTRPKFKSCTSTDPSLTFDTGAAVSGGSARSESDHHRRKHSALSAAVLPLDEVDPAVQVERQMFVAHEVLQRDVLNEAWRLGLPGGGWGGMRSSRRDRNADDRR